VLRTIRKYLGMDVAFIAHFRESDRVFEHVDMDGPPLIQPGQALPLETGYCAKVVRGELPQLIPDTSRIPAAMAIPETTAIPIGSHLSVPIVLDGGEVYGTLCCFGHAPDATLGEREMTMLEAFAEVLATRIAEMEQAEKTQMRRTDQVERDGGGSSADRLSAGVPAAQRKGGGAGVPCAVRCGAAAAAGPVVRDGA
jgi:GAF domain-containing protein